MPNIAPKDNKFISFELFLFAGLYSWSSQAIALYNPKCNRTAFRYCVLHGAKQWTPGHLGKPTTCSSMAKHYKVFWWQESYLVEGAQKVAVRAGLFESVELMGGLTHNIPIDSLGLLQCNLLL